MKFQICNKVFISSMAFFAILLLGGCEAKQKVAHEISADSTIEALDEEWSVYKNGNLGISVKFPTEVLEESPITSESDLDAVIPIKVIENGEIVTFSRGYMIDRETQSANKPLKVPEDLSVRKPYFSPAYLDDLSYPYKVYMAKIENADELESFVKRIYGEGCTPDGPSWYESKPRIEYYAIGGDKLTCPGYYPVGDVVSWNTRNGAAFSYIGIPVYFYMPRWANDRDEYPFYRIVVDWTELNLPNLSE